MSEQKDTVSTPFRGGIIKPSALQPDAAKLAHAGEVSRILASMAINAADKANRLKGGKHKPLPTPSAQDIAAGKFTDEELSPTEEMMYEGTLAWNKAGCPMPNQEEEPQGEQPPPPPAPPEGGQQPPAQQPPAPQEKTETQTQQ